CHSIDRNSRDEFCEAAWQMPAQDVANFWQQWISGCVRPMHPVRCILVSRYSGSDPGQAMRIAEGLREGSVTQGRPTGGRARYNVFISHAVQDATLVSSIAVALRYEGLRAFVATYHITPANEWLPDLERELRSCAALVALLSPAFRSSQWTDQEVGFALAFQRKIIPLQISANGLPHGFLQRYQALRVDNMSARQIA